VGCTFLNDPLLSKIPGAVNAQAKDVLLVFFQTLQRDFASRLGADTVPPGILNSRINDTKKYGVLGSSIDPFFFCEFTLLEKKKEM